MDDFRRELVIVTGAFGDGGSELAALVEAGLAYPEAA
jgi:predicted ATPase